MSEKHPTEPADDASIEADPRFPSGEWKGFFIQSDRPGRDWMELHLDFRDGQLRGEGRDRIGSFLIRGKYQVDDGRCWWNKAYVGKHDVSYTGYNEGKGIWGTWEVKSPWKGGFHIWPIAMGDPTQMKLKAEVEAPAPTDPELATPPPYNPEPTGAEPVGAEPVGAD